MLNIRIPANSNMFQFPLKVRVSGSRVKRYLKYFPNRSHAKFRRLTSHEPNRMPMRDNKGFFSFAFDSVHVKYTASEFGLSN